MLLYPENRYIVGGVIDGNKRVAQLMVNKVLINGGIGLFQIPIECICDFKKLLIEFYEVNDEEKIIGYMRENCLRF